MKNIILNFIKEKKKGISFVEIEKLFEKNNYEYKGPWAFCPSTNKHVVIWSGWSEEAINLMIDLEKENLIYFNNTGELVYNIDGNLPAAHLYKTDHWFPIYMSIK